MCIRHNRNTSVAHAIIIYTHENALYGSKLGFNLFSRMENQINILLKDINYLN